jgi:hypothetical protein
MFPVKSKTVLDFARAVGALLLVFAPLWAGAQVGPEMRSPPSLHVFGTATDGISGGNNSTGFTLGAYMQTRHVWGFEVRGAYLHWASNEFRYDAMLGPRVGLHFGRLSPYGAAMGGEGHVVKRKNGPRSPFESNSGGEWKLLGGVDFYAGHHFSIRLGEISYSTLYAFQQGISSVDFSSGFAYHIPVRER